jgi:galactonate dehydratase
MTTARAIRRMQLHVVEVSAMTRWMFIRLQRADGCVGCGEATLNGKEAAVRDAAARFAAHALSASVDDPGAFAAGVVPADLAEAAVVSAIDQAIWDLHAIDAGARLADVLGGAQRETIPIYANINRRTRPRTPEAFAQSARDAIAAGFNALKIAPFDEVDPMQCAAGDGRTAMQAGLDRIAAVRAIAGPDCRLMVDCLWRFDETTARELVDAAATLGAYWIECPLPESLANIAALVRLRKQANGLGIRLAGMEQGIRFEAFRPFCEAGAYDVMMPDVKYVGGLMEMLRCGQALKRHGVAISLHNPSGPVCHAASLHAAAAMDVFDMLELQFDESPLFDDLVAGALPRRIAGQSVLPSRPGLGIDLDTALLGEHVDGVASAWDAQ